MVVGVCNTDLAATELAGQAKAAMVKAMGRGMVSAGIRRHSEACVLRLAWASETCRQWWKGEGALVWTLDGAWKKLRQESGPSQGRASATLSPQLLEVGAPYQVTASIYLMPNTTFCVPWL